MPTKERLNYNYELVKGVFENYWEIPRSESFEVSQKLVNLSAEIQPKILLEQMQNYILMVLKSNPTQTQFIEDVRAIEKAKTEFNLGMKPEIIFDELCLKLIH